VQILNETIGANNIGSIFLELQPDTDKLRTKPFPLGTGHHKSGLGFQIASGDPGTQSSAARGNTECWIDPVKHTGGTLARLRHGDHRLDSC